MPIADVVKGMAIGTGVDLGGQIFGDGVIRTPTEGGGAQATDIFLTLVESQTDQDQALNLSDEVSAAFGLFGGSAKFDLSQAMHFHQFAITLIIRATVVNPFRQMRDVQLTESAKGPIRDGDLKRFREQFGDFFVRGLQSGGEFCAILQIIGKDAGDQTAVKAALQAGGIIGSVAVETNNNFSMTVQNATQNRETKFRHIQIGGTQTASIDPVKMIDHALTFASSVSDGPQGNSEDFIALLEPYSTLDRPPGPNFIDIQGAKDNLEIMMGKRSDALSRLAAFNFVVGHPEQFIIPQGMDPNVIVGRFETAIATITSAASRCVNKPSESQEALQSISNLNIPLDDLPPRRETIPTLAGVWHQSGSGKGNSDWTFTLKQANEYTATENGLGQAKGIAVVDGLKVTLNWSAVQGESGNYIFEVNGDFTSGDGTIDFIPPAPFGTLHNHWSRIT